RVYAFRKLARSMGKSERAAAVGALASITPDEERSEIWAVIGLELLALGQRDEAEKLAKLASGGRKDGASSLIALWLALGSPDAAADKKKLGADKAREIAPVPGGDKEGLVSPAARAGYAEGWARQGNIDKARWLASSGKPEESLRAVAALAG